MKKMELRDFFREMAGSVVYPNDAAIVAGNGEEWAGNILDAETTIIHNAKPKADFTVAEIDGYGYIVDDNTGNSFFETIEEIEAAFPGTEIKK